MKFIEFASAGRKERLPANYVRRSFTIAKPVAHAGLKITALGVYKGYLNGEPLDVQELRPGYTDYRFRLQVQEYDITGKLRQGENVIAAVIGDGWYRGAVGIGSKTNCYGTKTKFGCEIQITYQDGTVQQIGADDRFLVSSSLALRQNDTKVLEVYDARLDQPGWNSPGFQCRGWETAVPSAYEGKLIPQEGERLIAHESFSPSVIRTPDGSTVLDFSQNLFGFVRFTVTGSAGHQVRLTMGEVLDENGNFTLKNLSAEGASLISGPVGQELLYTLRDGQQTYRPVFLLCGFRYVKVENWPEEVKTENFRSYAVYSDIPFTGRFSCSDPGINRFVENVRWSQKSNFADIPTDCPQRERAGWSGDMSVFIETACYLSDPRKFLRKWLHDYILEQRADGSLPYVIPECGYSERQRSGLGWSNAIANIAMTLWRFYGETEDLALVYDAVRKYVEFNIRRAKKKNPLLLFSRHGKYVIETGFHYGEWLEPGRPMYKDFIRALFYPDTEFTTAYFYLTAKQLSEMAHILGKTEDESRYAELAESIKKDYRRVFLKNGAIPGSRQCRFVRPIWMGLLGREEEDAAASKLNDLCVANQYKIGTGFHTTYKILPVLCDHGYAETAFRMLRNDNCPGWLYEVKKGATTTWENWNGIDEQGKPADSHNHFSPGAMCAWLFAYVGGIRSLKPGFEEILISPFIGGNLRFAETEYQSIKGKIVSRWQLEGSRFYLDVEIPEETKACIHLPNGETREVNGGTHHFSCEVSCIE